MNKIALKMLIGDRAKFIGIIIGLTFASLLITQQGAIFVGIIYRTFGVIADAGYPDIWVMDPKVQYIEDITPIAGTQLYRVRSVPGVASAVPLYKGTIKARLRSGTFQACAVLGIDDTTLTGGPPTMVEGTLADLRHNDGVIVDDVGASTKLATIAPDGRSRSLAIGDALELNDRRATVVGICRVSRSFQSQPIIYTTYSRALSYAPPERRQMSFVLVKAAPGADIPALCREIRAKTELAAYTSDQFKWITANYFIQHTGILVNFSIGIGLGIVVGAAIAGQAFYNFTLDNRRYFSVLKAMGVRRGVLLRMILFQASVAGFIGYGLGVGCASLFGYFARDSELAFRLPRELLVISCAAVLMICAGAALLSVARVLRMQPAEVFRT